ncbi:MAG: virulence factor [Chloroflexota bacterium]
MSLKYQIVYWRDIPAQIKGKVGRKRVSRMLSKKFQVAIDEAAMQGGMSDTDSYLQEWRSTDWATHDGDADEFLDKLAAEFESQYSGARLKGLMVSGGFDTEENGA